MFLIPMCLNYLITFYNEERQMHHKKLFISYIVLSSVIIGFADNARFHVQVLDSVTSEPVPNISMKTNLCPNPGSLGQKQP